MSHARAWHSIPLFDPRDPNPDLPRNNDYDPKGVSPHILQVTKNYKAHKSSESNLCLLTVVTACPAHSGRSFPTLVHCLKQFSLEGLA